MTDAVVEVVGADALQERVRQLGAEITADYRERVPVLLGVLHGSVMFLADLVRALDIDVRLEFLALTRFGEEGRVNLAMDTERPLEGEDVIIVEDIVDTGFTLVSMRRMLEARGVASIATVALLDKAPRRIVEVPVEYRGFEIGDEFLLGYGLDWDGRFRNLRALWAVMDLIALQERPETFVSRFFPGLPAGKTPGDRLTP